MRGFLRPRGDAWELRVYLGRDTITGRKRYACRTVRGSRREAERVLARMVGDADRGDFARTGATTGELLERWFAHARADFSPKTVRETRRYLDRDLLPALGGLGQQPWLPDSVSRRFRLLCRRAELDGVRLHDLRHYVATRLLAAGVDVRRSRRRSPRRRPPSAVVAARHTRAP